MNPKIWGPHAWFLIHSICLNYPENPTEVDKKNYKNFFLELSNVLPCEECQNHFKKNMKKYNIDTHLNTKKIY